MAPVPAPSLGFPPLHCQPEPRATSQKPFLNQHLHLIYLKEARCFLRVASTEFRPRSQTLPGQ